MPSGKTKAQKTIELKNAGADVVSTVTKKCTHLLVDNVNGSSSKIKKAQAKKIAIVDEDWIDRKMGLSSKTKKTKPASKSNVKKNGKKPLKLKSTNKSKKCEGYTTTTRIINNLKI